MQPAKRAAINRANAQKSTGPRTEAGKRRSSLNAFRHGLTGQTIVMPHEDMDAYNVYCKRAFDELKPQGLLEELAVQTIADSTWRLHRARAYETTLFSAAFSEHSETITTEHPEAHCALAQAQAAPELTKTLSNLSGYEQRLARGLQNARKDLADLQAARRIADQAALKTAKLLRNFNQSNKIDWEPGSDGFVFTGTELDRQNDLDARIKRAEEQLSNQKSGPSELKVYWVDRESTAKTDPDEQ